MKQNTLYIFLLVFAISLMACNTGENAFDTREGNGLSGYGANPESHPYGSQYYGDGLNGSMNNDDNISSDKTTIPSDKYPETKAIQIQEAKYKFVVEGKHGGSGKKQWRHGQKGEIPNNQAGEETPQQGQPEQQEQPEQPEQPEQQEQNESPHQADPAPNQEPAQTEQQPQMESEGEGTGDNAAETDGISGPEARVIELTNEQRRNNGLPELEADTELSGVARRKSIDMQENNYFSHTSPTYGSPFDMIRDAGVSYNAAGENIAQGQQTPEQVVESWMNSEGHRANILSTDFTHIGVGYTEAGHHWTQMFISR
ncbi:MULTISPECIES: CAP domain-containing protein [Bacillaceae]|uniref:CAP domain-containing protein n=1 Tax=Bacillaceae TaxID=186817 RepID=UPI001F195FD5|nr:MULTISPECIES: CAP domain-containing protein [Bacillaceae]